MKVRDYKKKKPELMLKQLLRRRLRLLPHNQVKQDLHVT